MIEILAACHITQLEAMRNPKPMDLPDVHLPRLLPIMAPLAMLLLTIAALAHVY